MDQVFGVSRVREIIFWISIAHDTIAKHACTALPFTQQFVKWLAMDPMDGKK